MSRDNIYSHGAFKYIVLRELLHPERAVTLSSEELEILIKAAQANDPVAIQRLYDGFLMLIYDLVKEDYIYSRLQEDATGIAIEAFLKLIKIYKGPDYYHFPGLVKKVIKDRLYNAVRRQEQQKVVQVSYEQRAEQGMELMDEVDAFTNLVNDTVCREALKQLPEEEQMVLYCRFYLNLSSQEQAELLGSSLRTIQRRYQKALHHLQALMGHGDNSFS